MKNLLLFVTLCCSLITHAQHTENKNADSINANRKRFLIDIYDTANPKTRITTAHEVVYSFSTIAGYVSFENYITYEWDTTYPDLPLNDSTVVLFPEYLLVHILKGGILAYSQFYSENELIKPLSTREALELHLVIPDIDYLVDPTVSESVPKIIPQTLRFDGTTQLDVIAHKVRNIQSGKMNWTITAIAPMKKIYADDGTYRGHAAMYWIKYEDVKNIITSYEKLHKECIISKGIQDILDGKGTERHFE